MTEKSQQHRFSKKYTSFPPLSSLAIAAIPRREPNPHLPQIVRSLHQNARRTGLVVNDKHFNDHITMNAWLWPDASAERLMALSYFNVIGFYIDDTIGNDLRDNAVANAEALRAVVAYKALNVMVRGLIPVQTDKYDRAFMELDRMIRQLSNGMFVARLYPALFEHWQAATTNFEPTGVYEGTVEEFIGLRRLTGGMAPTIMLTELAQDNYMPARLPEFVPALAKAIEAAGDIGALSNELFSFEKEVIYGGSTFNLVAVIHRNNPSQTMAWAVHQAIGIVDQAYTDFQQAAIDAIEQADAIEDPEQRALMQTFVSEYVEGLWDVAAASYHWQMETNRYRSETSPFPDLRMLKSA